MAINWDKLYMNWATLGRLMVDVATPVGGEFLRSKLLLPLEQELQDRGVKRKLLKLKQKKILHQSQWDILYPVFQPNKLDLTLLMLLVNNIAPNVTQCEKANLDKIRNYRNELAHIATAAISDQDFARMWRVRKTAILNLVQPAAMARWKKEIKTLKHSPLLPQTHYIQTIIKSAQDEIEDLIKQTAHDTETVLISKMDEVEINMASKVEAEASELKDHMDAGQATVMWKVECAAAGLSGKLAEINDNVNTTKDTLINELKRKGCEVAIPHGRHKGGLDKVDPPSKTPRLSQKQREKQVFTNKRPQDLVYRVIHNSGLCLNDTYITLHLQVAGTRFTIWAGAGGDVATAVNSLQLVTGEVISGVSGEFTTEWWPLPGFSEYWLYVTATRDIRKIYDSPNPFWTHSVPEESYRNLADICKLPRRSWFNVRATLTNTWRPTGDTKYTHTCVLKDESVPDGLTVEFIPPQAEALEELMSDKQSFKVAIHYGVCEYGGERRCLLVTSHTHVFCSQQLQK